MKRILITPVLLVALLLSGCGDAASPMTTPGGVTTTPGEVWAWGSNSFGKLGNGTSTTSLTPVQALSLSGVTAIAGGDEHSLALKSDGTVWAWGWNSSGQLGNGTSTNSSTPVQVLGLSGVTVISAGGYHSLAVESPGTSPTPGADPRAPAPPPTPMPTAPVAAATSMPMPPGTPRPTPRPAPPPTPLAEVVCGPSEQVRTFIAGEKDNFHPDLDTPPAAPSSGLQIRLQSLYPNEPLAGFDVEGQRNLIVAHTFSGLPGNITDAWLELHVKPSNHIYAIPATDSIALWFTGPGGAPAGNEWAAAIGPQVLPGPSLLPQWWQLSNYPSGAFFELHLSALPLPPTSVIAGMNANGLLDVVVADDSVVDHLLLTLCSSAPPPMPALTPVAVKTPVAIATPPPTPTPMPLLTTRVTAATPTPTPKATDLTLDKFANLPFHYGQQASYTILVQNQGSGTAASPITVVDVLSNGLTYISLTTPYSSDWSCSATGQTVTCIYAGPDIAPGGVLPSLIINVQIARIADFPASSDRVENCATVRYGNDVDPGNDHRCVSTVITSPGAAGGLTPVLAR